MLEREPAAPRTAASALADEGLAQLCTFRVGGEDYAIDIMRVREIIPPAPVTPVPRAPSFVEGVVRLRGDVIPVLDVRRRLGLPVTPATRKTKYLIVSVAGRRLGLVVDEVTEVLRIPRAQIRPPPALVEGGGARFFLGVCGGEGGATATGRRSHARAGRIRLLLNVKALLDPVAPGEPEAARSEAEATRRS
jgi:purine-binding chemotaxis protein CheW